MFVISDLICTTAHMLADTYMCLHTPLVIRTHAHTHIHMCIYMYIYLCSTNRKITSMRIFWSLCTHALTCFNLRMEARPVKVVNLKLERREFRRITRNTGTETSKKKTDLFKTIFPRNMLLMIETLAYVWHVTCVFDVLQSSKTDPRQPTKTCPSRWRSIYGLHLDSSPFLRVELADARDVGGTKGWDGCGGCCLLGSQRNSYVFETIRKNLRQHWVASLHNCEFIAGQ